MSEYLLQMLNISKTFPGVKALDDVKLEVKKGEVHALIGENGAGKSTLIKILAGVYQPDPGAQFFFEGKEAKIRRPIDATMRGISIIYQDLSLFPNLSVAENIYIGRDSDKHSWKKVDWALMEKTAKKALKELDFEIDVSTPVEKLSIAQQQMVEIARALAFDAKLIVMDEPTSSLSAGEVEKLYEVIFSLKKRGISIIFVSHKLKELFTVSDRFTVLRDGKYVGTYHANELTEEKLITLMVGRKILYEKNKEKAASGKTLLEVRNLAKEGNFKDISFELREGEVLGITGLVGSGRTELAQAIFGINRPYKGDIIINGQKTVIKSSEEAVKKGIAYIPESRKTQGLILRQSIINNISLPVLKKLKNKFLLINRRKEIELAEHYIQSLDVRPPLPYRAAGDLSGGNQQKVVIGKWLSTNPKILIIDEPTNGIDIGAKSEIHKLLRGLAANGMGIIVISSELPEVLAVSDRIIVMRHGRIAGELGIHEATQESIMNLALLGQKGKIREEAQL
ncbi:MULTISPECIES: sugar ABC transporter ATP-binding protein [Aeribacillus]|jgi:ABC-type sugar transport system, ATPase component|uniref:sugar ABC transporter ATP-binding protein n=1 Tax=Aeribacillus TaxID=1055323 RepID=UPI00119905E0|nr:sugar ABC transporter ATP-binding protein [Aeribacillus composti]BBU37965.1 ribose import ATP-binding protein RbsA [Aeribacillus pallidus]MED0702371.1 sugar ABC transporter ATP-binding protein [Aeribacillus composti]MED0716200.1 sugar ABC transporter ATP-binding protein [Aeribacillus composti]MED0746481.1 sugar ABC transporter ATP-binding protein [Aeribacillus composti]TVZ87643.1 ribose transport system ATP-binding protein/rhamnose transport system ATP-binding protein [Aeribacillus composti